MAILMHGEIKRGKKYIVVFFIGFTMFSISGISMSDKIKSSKPVLDERAIHDCAERLKALVRLIESMFKKYNSFPIESLAAVSLVPGIDFSDHWSFWKMDYPAVMITDTSFYRNTNYHKKTDTYETLDYLSMARVIRGFYRVLIELVGDTNYPVK
jgi:hypothetical protein